MTEYRQMTTSITVVPDGKAIYCQEATKFKIDDDGGGEFVVIEQEGKTIGISPEEWPIFKKVIERMIKQCRC